MDKIKLPPIAAMTVFCNEAFRIDAWKEYYSVYSKYLSLHVIINNGRKEDTELLKKHFPDSVVLTNTSSNLLAAYNLGLAEILQHPEIEAIMQITNDIKFDETAIPLLWDALAKHPDVAIAGPIVFKKDSTIIESCGWKLHKRSAAGKPLFNGVDYNFIKLGKDIERIPDIPDMQEVTFVPAGAIMVRRSAWEKVGPQDEKIYMYQDERDLALRLHQIGYREIIITKAHAWHQHENRPGTSARPMSSAYYSARNRIYVTRKHFGNYYAFKEFLSFALYTVGLMSYHTLTGQFGKLKYSRTVLKALFDGLRGCNGPINYV